MAENKTAQQPVHDATDENENALSTRIAKKADSLKYYLLGAVVVLAAVVGIVLHTGNTRAKERTAASDSVFRSFVELQGKPPAEAAPALIATAKQFAGQPAGIQAAVHAFGVSLDAGNYAEAETAGNDFIRNYPESPLIPRFRVAVAQAQLLQGKTQAAIDALRVFVGTAGPETLPEAKLALAQALGQFAEEAKDDPAEYTRRLEAAEAEYSDIASRARMASPLQGGFWPQVVNPSSPPRRRSPARPSLPRNSKPSGASVPPARPPKRKRRRRKRLSAPPRGWARWRRKPPPGKRNNFNPQQLI